METSQIVGYVSALFIGITLGLIGGGGSILSVPVLSYLFHFDEKVSTAYSLCIVGIGALVGGLQKNAQKLVDWKTALFFGIPSIIGVWFIRHEIIPIIPNTVFSIDTFVLTRKKFMFGFFAIIMMLSAYAMISGSLIKNDTSNKQFSKIWIVVAGIITGIIAGFVGAGGGFLIIPALTLFMKMDMKLAIGTSLIIIAVQSLIGFLLGDALAMSVDWKFLSIISSITVIGISVGSYFNKRIDAKKLKTYFGYFVIAMAIFIILKEFIFVNKP